MKILATSDIHQAASKWKDLVKICQKNKFDVIAIAGDLMPKDTDIEGQLGFIPNLKKYLKKIKDTGAKTVLMLGNDDNQNLIPVMEQMEQEGLIYFASEKVVEIDGQEFIGMPYVPDYPFTYKFWCRGETNEMLRIDPMQYGEPFLINKNNKLEEIKRYSDYLKEKKKIWDSLIDLSEKVKDRYKSIWLIHAPPANLNLDICASGHRVGSHAVLNFIKEYQPLLTIHGHIHEAPDYNGHVWFNRVDKTICVQAGQMYFKLFYTVIDVIDGSVVNMNHSIYGDELWNYKQRI